MSSKIVAVDARKWKSGDGRAWLVSTHPLKVSVAVSFLCGSVESKTISTAQAPVGETGAFQVFDPFTCELNVTMTSNPVVKFAGKLSDSPGNFPGAKHPNFAKNRVFGPL